MSNAEAVLFDAVLKETGFIVKSQNNGLYILQHKLTGGNEDYIQTNGYNLLESLRRLTTSDLAKVVLA